MNYGQKLKLNFFSRFFQEDKFSLTQIIKMENKIFLDYLILYFPLRNLVALPAYQSRQLNFSVVESRWICYVSQLPLKNFHRNKGRTSGECSTSDKKHWKHVFITNGNHIDTLAMSTGVALCFRRNNKKKVKFMFHFRCGCLHVEAYWWNHLIVVRGMNVVGIRVEWNIACKSDLNEIWKLHKRGFT